MGICDQDDSGSAGDSLDWEEQGLEDSYSDSESEEPPGGLAETQIDSLPLMRYRTIVKSRGQQGEHCSICLSEL